MMCWNLAIVAWLGRVAVLARRSRADPSAADLYRHPARIPSRRDRSSTRALHLGRLERSERKRRRQASPARPESISDLQSRARRRRPGPNSLVGRRILLKACSAAARVPLVEVDQLPAQHVLGPRTSRSADQHGRDGLCRSQALDLAFWREPDSGGGSSKAWIHFPFCTSSAEADLEPAARRRGITSMRYGSGALARYARICEVDRPQAVVDRPAAGHPRRMQLVEPARRLGPCLDCSRCLGRR